LICGLKWNDKAGLRGIIAICPIIYGKAIPEIIDFLAFFRLEKIAILLAKPAAIKKRMQKRGVAISDDEAIALTNITKNNHGIERLLSIERIERYLFRKSKRIEMFNKNPVSTLFIFGKKDEKLNRNSIVLSMKDFGPFRQISNDNDKRILMSENKRELVIFHNASHAIHYQFPRELSRLIVNFCKEYA
jgi:pimeloyl-ACP methyl ester carboxylesterase